MTDVPIDLKGDIADSAARAAVPTLLEGALNGDATAVQRALGLGVDANAHDPEGRTALMFAAFNGHDALCQQLLDKGATIDHRDQMGRTALMFASTGPFPQTVALLIQGGADVNCVDGGEGWSPLMFAAAEGHLPVLETLLKHGAKRDVIDTDGDTALSFAEQKGHKEAATFITEYPE